MSKSNVNKICQHVIEAHLILAPQASGRGSVPEPQGSSIQFLQLVHNEQSLIVLPCSMLRGCACPARKDVPSGASPRTHPWHDV